jgi:hypothetical protein
MPLPLRFMTISLAALLLPALLAAQAITDWPKPSTHPDFGTVDLVAVSDPGMRHKCRVHSISADTITCGAGFARKLVVYPRDNVAAIISRPNHLGEHVFFVFITIAVAGTVAAAIFLPPLAAVAIGIPSILFALGTAMFTDGDSDGGNVLYQHPNTPLTVTLR